MTRKLCMHYHYMVIDMVHRRHSWVEFKEDVLYVLLFLLLLSIQIYSSGNLYSSIKKLLVIVDSGCMITKPR